MQGSGPARSHPLYLAGGGEGTILPEVVSFNILLNKNFCKYPAQNQNGIFYFSIKKESFQFNSRTQELILPLNSSRIFIKR